MPGGNTWRQQKSGFSNGRDGGSGFCRRAFSARASLWTFRRARNSREGKLRKVGGSRKGALEDEYGRVVRPDAARCKIEYG